MNTRTALACLLPVVVLAALPSAASAHSTPGVSGFAHPLSGLDHLVAMLAVGLWAGQRGGRAAWMIPTTFVAVLAAGAWLGARGVALPMVEPGIAASVLVLGLLVAAAARWPLAASAALVALFAVAHGHAHGSDMPLMASAVHWWSGFLAATAAVLAAGAVIGRLATRPGLVRAAGGAVAACGLYFLVT
jgi:urease accessory protein